MPTEDELSELLRSGAETIHLEGRGPTAARARAQQRRRRRVGAASLAFGLLAGAGVVGWESWGGDSATEVEIRQAVDGQAVVESGAVEFEWAPADDVVGYLQRSRGIASDGSYYAVSTAPGLRWEDIPPGSDAAEVIYRSDDLLTWDAVELESNWLSDLDTADGLLYAVGTAPETGNDAGAPRLSTSSDGGETWEHELAPVSIDVEPGQPFVASGRRQIAATSDVVVALMSTRLVPDVQALVPDGSGAWAEVVENGVQVYVHDDETDPLDCETMLESTVPPPTVAADDPVETEAPPTTGPPAEYVPACGEPVPGPLVPWSELGVDSPDDLVASDLFVSTDRGATWEREDGSAFDGLYVEDIQRTPDGLVAWGQRAGSAIGDTAILISEDGASWTDVSAPGQTQWISEVGVVDDRLVAIDGESNVRIHVSDDGGLTWQTSFLPDEERLLGRADIGPLGVVVFALTPDEDDRYELLFSREVATWSEVELPPQLTGRSVNLNWMTVGPDRIGLSVSVWDGTEETTENWVATPVR